MKKILAVLLMLFFSVCNASSFNTLDTPTVAGGNVTQPFTITYDGDQQSMGNTDLSKFHIGGYALASGSLSTLLGGGDFAHYYFCHNVSQTNGVFNAPDDNTAQPYCSVWSDNGLYNTYQSPSGSTVNFSSTPTYSFNMLTGQMTLNQTNAGGNGTTYYGLSINPVYNQTGTAAATDIYLNRTGTVGSGNQYLMQLNNIGADKFHVDIFGNVVAQGYSTNYSLSTAPYYRALAVGRYVNTGTTAITVSGNAATTYLANIAATGVTITLAIPTADGERRRIVFGGASTGITWAFTAPATAQIGLPTTVVAGQAIEIVYNSVAGTPANSAATTWYQY